MRAANGAGGIDNITVVVLDLLEGDPPGEHGRRRRPGSGRRLGRTGGGGGAANAAALGAMERDRPRLRARARRGADRPARMARHAVVRRGREGHVAVFQGIPADVFGFELSRTSPRRRTSRPPTRDGPLPLYTELQQGINVNSREDAAARVEQIRKDCGPRNCSIARQGRRRHPVSAAVAAAPAHAVERRPRNGLGLLIVAIVASVVAYALQGLGLHGSSRRTRRSTASRSRPRPPQGGSRSTSPPGRRSGPVSGRDAVSAAWARRCSTG